jgi:TPR repeat protein
MNRTFKAAVATLMLAVTFAGSVAAGTYEDAFDAYEKGDYARALRLTRPLAEQELARGSDIVTIINLAGAQYNLGLMYANGQGVPQDYKAAMSWYRKAAELGNAYARFNLGLMYYEGQGVPQDFAAAASWYRKAAEQGDAVSQINLGVMYAKGQGVPNDYSAAVSWYRKAAEQDYGKAQFNLEVMYANGQGVPQDFVTAHMWFNLAAAGGLKDAIINRDVIASKMTPAQIAEAQKLAREWKPTPR